MASPTRSNDSFSAAIVRTRKLRSLAQQAAHDKDRSHCSKNFACPRRRRWYAHHCGQSADPACGGRREGARRSWYRLCDYQRQATTWHGDVDRAARPADPDCWLQRRRICPPRPLSDRKPYARSGDGQENRRACLLYTSDAADEEDSVDLGGRRIIKKK